MAGPGLSRAQALRAGIFKPVIIPVHPLSPGYPVEIYSFHAEFILLQVQGAPDDVNFLDASWAAGKNYYIVNHCIQEDVMNV